MEEIVREFGPLCLGGRRDVDTNSFACVFFCFSLAQKLQVKESLIPDAGNGLFASGFIAAGQVVCRYEGDVLSTQQAIRWGCVCMLYVFVWGICVWFITNLLCWK